MLVVHTAPVVEASRFDGWELVLWLGEAFDFSIPFRASLAQIARLLGEEPAKALTLPPVEDDEDFVEGSLRFGAAEVKTFFEFSLGYLSLSHPTREPLDFIARKLGPAIEVRRAVSSA